MHTKTNQIWLWVFAYISHCIAPVFLYDLELFRTRIKNKKSFTNKTSYLNNDYCIRAQFVCNSIEGAFLCMQNIYGWKFANAKWKLQQWSVVVIFFCIVFLIFFHPLPRAYNGQRNNANKDTTSSNKAKYLFTTR